MAAVTAQLTTLPSREPGATASATEVPGPNTIRGRHVDALDGIRAWAVLGVLAYHLGFGWASGGFLGVDLFFVLSGFLITSLLLEERLANGRIGLGAFWGRRARRLLPALFLVVAALAVFVFVQDLVGPVAGTAIDLGGLRADALATLLYVANWHSVFAHHSYFAQISTPSPLQHTWSLAIEEQFYLVWPLVTVGLLRWARSRWRQVGVLVCVAGAAASTVAMVLYFHPGIDPSRAYYGTDTRAFDILVGAGLAFLTAGRPEPSPRGRNRLHVAAVFAAAGLGAFWVTAGTASAMPTTFMFEGGFLVCALLAGLVIADARQSHQGPLGRMLRLRPLRWIGRISYGLYLWHWPVFVYATSSRVGVTGAALDVVRVALTFALATASYYLLELPVRRRSFWKPGLRLVAPAAALATAGLVMVTTTIAVAMPTGGWTFGGLRPNDGSAVVGAGGFESETPIVLPSGTAGTGKALKVMTFGDSVMSYAQTGISAALTSTGRVRLVEGAIPGWGVNKASMATLLSMVRSERPQLLLGTWTWDNGTAKADPANYRRTLDAALRTLLAPRTGVQGVILLEMPPLGPLPASLADTWSRSLVRTWQQRRAGLPVWNAAVAEAPQVFPGKVMYLPVGSALALDGRFTGWLPKKDDVSLPPQSWVRVRTVDGVHLCPPGITRYAAPVLADFVDIFHLPSPSGPWWSNPYIVRANANKAGVGAYCPDDHPPRSVAVSP